MSVQNLLPLALVFFTAWLLGLSFLAFLGFKFLNRLTKGVRKGNLIKVLDSVLAKEAKNSKEVRLIKKEIDAITDEGKLHVQKIGLVRFNPFEELGGDHSFSLAVLDGKGKGFVITGLHTRDRTRVYVKSVGKGGRPAQKLSVEEKKALEQALK